MDLMDWMDLVGLVGLVVDSGDGWVAGCDFFRAKGGKIRGIWQKGVQRSCIYI